MRPSAATLEIAAFTGPVVGGNGAHFDLLKPALIYAERVTLNSSIAFLFKAALDFDQASTIQQLYLLRYWARACGPEGRQIVEEQVLPAYRDALSGSHETKPKQAEEFIYEIFDGLRPKVQRWADRNLRVDLIRSMVDNNLLVVNTVEDGLDELRQQIEYLDSVISIFFQQEKTPIFDGEVSGFVKDRLSEYQVSDNLARKAWQTATAQGLLAKIPAFPGIRMDEIPDLRRALESPLTRFRAAMVDLSSSTVHPSTAGGLLDMDFHDVWHGVVAPALQELDELSRENSTIRVLRDTVLQDGTLMAKVAAGGLALSHIGAVDVAPVISGVVPAAAVAVAKALHERLRAGRKLRRHGYFLLHAIQKRADA